MTALEGKALLDHAKAIARRYARRIGPEAAEELSAEAILRALASPPPDGHLEPWLERIYRNLFVDLWRRGSVRTAEGVDVDALPAHGTPEDEVLRRERRRLVRASLRGLPRESRRAVLSKYYGEDHDDVAAARLRVAPVTVRTRIHRALARLRLHLGELRAGLPTWFGRLGGQLMSAGVAPAMVAALAVANIPPAPEVPTARPTVVEVGQVAAEVAPPVAANEVVPAPVVRPSARTHAHKARVTAVAAEAEPFEVDRSEVAVGHVLGPDGLVIFADPEPLESPCMVEAPATFIAQIDKMVEDVL